MGEENAAIGGGDNATGEKKTDKDEQLTVLKVDMHCDACAKKVVKALRPIQGVEDIAVDRKESTIAIKGMITDPTELCHRVHSKTGRSALLVSPLPKSSVQLEPKDDNSNKDQPSTAVTVVLRVQMHCEACAQQLRKRIRKVKGVETVETNVGKSEVKVKGVIANAQELADYVYKKTRKRVSIVKDEEKQVDNKAMEKKEVKDEKETDSNSMTSELQRSQQYWESPTSMYRSYMEHPNTLNYDPLYLSDDNPNACSVM